MTHYIIADAVAQGKKAEADYREKNSGYTLIQVLSPRNARSFEGAHLFPGDTFEEVGACDSGTYRVWDVLLRSAVKSKVKIRRQMGKWVALGTVDHPIWRVDPLLDDVRRERVEQLRKWGEQHHEFRREDKVSFYRYMEAKFKAAFEHQTPEGATWDVILLEEVYEALAEDDPKKRVAELIQVAAVALAIAEDIQGRDDG